MSKISVVIPSYKGADRVEFLLRTVKENDPNAFMLASWLVVEDYSGDSKSYEDYDALVESYPVCVHHLSEWANMHGAAQQAFLLAIGQDNPDWIIYLGDDLAVTPKALSNLIFFLTMNELKTVGLVQPSYWNAADLCNSEEGEWGYILDDMKYKKPLWRKSDFYKSTDWTCDIPKNPHWEGWHWDKAGWGKARPYVNVNGVGFACRADHYLNVGGFAEGTWCLDESISVRTWLKSNYSIVALPGPPLVHYFGGSTGSNPPKHDLGTKEAWEAAMGMTKEAADVMARKCMAERQEAVIAEMDEARYYE